MGIFAKLSEMAYNQALRTMKAYSDGRSNPVDAMNALKTLANAGKLFFKQGGRVYNLECYYWVNGSEVENVEGMTYMIQSVSSDGIVCMGNYKFRKAYARDCEEIKFNAY